MKKDHNQFRFKADLILVLVAILWGSAFAVQRSISNHIGVFTFNGLRFLLASFILLVAMLVMLRFEFHQPKQGRSHNDDGIHNQLTQRNLVYITIAGVFLFSASAFQQAGLRFTTAGNAGFITSLYVVMVPILLRIFWHIKISPITWAGALLAVIGSLMLSGKGYWDLSNGDLLVLSGALFWGLHVILVGIAGRRMNIMLFAFGQYFVAGILNIIASLWIEGFGFEIVRDTIWAIVYTGLFSIALGYTLQIFAQKYSSASDTAIILSMEAVFASIFGFIFLGEIFSFQQIVGCSLIMIAIIVTALYANKAKGIVIIDDQRMEITSDG